MKSVRISIALVVILAPCSFSGQATSQPKQSEIDTANRLFQVGKFAEAGKLYSRMAAQNPKDYSATLQLGRIALLSKHRNVHADWSGLKKAIPARAPWAMLCNRDQHPDGAAKRAGIVTFTK